MAREVHKWLPEEVVKTENGRFSCSFQFDGTLRQILVVPLTPDTMYDFGLKDENGMVFYSKLDQKGYLATENLNLVVFPGEKTLILENATRDEEFKVKLIYQL